MDTLGIDYGPFITFDLHEWLANIVQVATIFFLYLLIKLFFELLLTTLNHLIHVKIVDHQMSLIGFRWINYPFKNELHDILWRNYSTEIVLILTVKTVNDMWKCLSGITSNTRK